MGGVLGYCCEVFVCEDNRAQCGEVEMTLLIFVSLESEIIIDTSYFMLLALGCLISFVVR